jgi:hypothetical protein
VGDKPLTDDELRQLEALSLAASPAPWRAFYGPAIGGDDFIQLSDDDEQPDMYVQHDDRPAPASDLDFIAAARNYVPRLLAEVRRCRNDGS